MLGAGFSRAISSEMPVMANLLLELVEFVREHRPQLVNGDRLVIHDLEGFLTFLAARQPFLTDAENAENAGLFERVSGWLGDEISHRQRRALDNAMPSWLATLVAEWHSERAAVLTLNYDTLVEAAVNALTLKSDDADDRVQPWDLYPVPIPLARAQGGTMFGTHNPKRSAATFRLLKLHGSITWHYPGLRVVGPPVDATGYGVFADVAGDVDPIARYWSGGLTPMIVPPTTSKSDYLDNATMLRTWLSARHELDAASTIFLIGYSLPTADVQFASLLAMTVNGTVVVVNPDSEVVERVRRVCNAPVDASYAGDPDCVRRFVDSYAS